MPAPGAVPRDRRRFDAFQHPDRFFHPHPESRIGLRAERIRDSSTSEAEEQTGDWAEVARPVMEADRGIQNMIRLMKRQGAVLRRLRSWYQRNPSTHRSLIRLLWSGVSRRSGIPEQSLFPSSQELSSLAFFYFPPRPELLVTICDYGDGKLERFEVFLRDYPQGACNCRQLLIC